MAACTTRSPGSLIPGVPASVTGRPSPAPQSLQQVFASFGLVESEIAQQRLGNAEMFEQLSSAPRVFRCHDIALSECSQRAQGNIFEVANWCRDQIKVPATKGGKSDSIS